MITAAISNKYVEDLSDEKIVKRINEMKDSELKGILYDRYANKVFYKCQSFFCDSSIAKDLTQDIFIKVYSNLSSFSGKSKFATWLYAITRNSCIDFYRKNRNNAISPIDKYEEIIMSTDDIEIKKQLEKYYDQLDILLEKINAEEKKLLYLRYYKGLSLDEILNKYCISESAVKMRLKRVRDKLKMYKEELYQNAN